MAHARPYFPVDALGPPGGHELPSRERSEGSAEANSCPEALFQPCVPVKEGKLLETREQHTRFGLASSSYTAIVLLRCSYFCSAMLGRQVRSETADMKRLGGRQQRLFG
jgi:hypothetical protein